MGKARRPYLQSNRLLPYIGLWALYKYLPPPDPARRPGIRNKGSMSFYGHATGIRMEGGFSAYTHLLHFPRKSLGHRSYVLIMFSLIIRSPRLSSCLNMKKWVNNLVSLSPSYRNMTRLSCRLGAMVRFGVRSTWSRTSGAGWPHTSGSANQKLAW